MTSGYLAGQLAKSSWEELIKNALFTPLGMKRSNFTVAAMHAEPNHSEAYELNTKREVVKVEHEPLDTMGPTGSINSSVDEMARYARMMLAGGSFEGKRVLLEADVQSMMQPHMPSGKSLFSDVFGFQSYGMGLFVQTYRGIEIAHHGGNLKGASAMIVMVPSKRIGVVVQTNRSGTRLRDALPYEIIDRLLGLESAGLLARYRELEEKGFAAEDAAKSAGVSDRKPNTKPAHALPDYAADYEHPGYGRIRIGFEKDRLTLGYYKFTTPLDHWHYEVFQAPADRQNDLELTRVQFHTDLSGDIASLTIPIEPNVDPISFTRQPPAEMRERKFLDALCRRIRRRRAGQHRRARRQRVAIQRARKRARADPGARHLFPDQRSRRHGGGISAQCRWSGGSHGDLQARGRKPDRAAEEATVNALQARSRGASPRRCLLGRGRPDSCLRL